MRERKSIAIFLVAFISILMSNHYVFADDNEYTRRSLKGLKGVYVLPVTLGGEVEELKKVGLSTETIRTDVELKLRMAGINVISKKEDLYKTSGMPQLSVSIVDAVTVSIPPKTGIAFHIDVTLSQSAFLTDGQLTLATTWSQGLIGLGSTDENIVTQIRNFVKDISDRFINAYLSVNPKGGK